ncbi:hypothetical protein PTTW11_08470 [Pyrenophora teres f. teres]|uniref:Uncharacterized protein n=1 Tax=Pyrenophora teres f. teres TaxID=97479 RepID=A0A6S6WAB1_9PLEO|nr:hypothetical protein PTTW11_08470 [Pyrenophora teres f. teres]
MIIIIAIPSYYLKTSYSSSPSPKTHPTTTTRYIVLAPTPCPTTATRNYTIAKDVLTWGWLVYSADISLPGNNAWFTKYQAAAQNTTWEEDLWRIWQREHFVRILAREEGRTGESGLLGMVRSLGGWVKRELDGRGAREGELREWEERRRQGEGHLKKSESIVSLKGSFMQRLEGLTAAKTEGSGASDELPTVLLTDSMLEDGNLFLLKKES